VLFGLVILVAFGSSAVHVVYVLGQPGRWLALVVLLAIATCLAFTLRSTLRLTAPLIASGFLCGVALVSTAWSVLPRLTFERAVSFALLVAALGLLAMAAANNRELARRLMIALLLGAVALAFAGILFYIVDPGRAVQAATASSGSRFIGIGQNPDTLPLLYGVTVPVGVWLTFTATTVRGWRVWGGATLLLLASISASGSRGALIGAAPASFLVTVLTHQRDRLPKALAITAAAMAASVAGTALSVPAPAPKVPTAVAGVGASGGATLADRYGSIDAPTLRGLVAPDGSLRVHVPELSADPNEVGRPRLGQPLTQSIRTLFGSSGRAQAWVGGIEQSRKRPFFGFGFGTEERVFIDHFYIFQSARIENSYLGFWLQTGLLGVAAFVTVLVLLAARLVRFWPQIRARTEPGTAAVGIAVAGAAMAVPQSYAYSVGNVATATFWFGILFFGAMTFEQSR
jgi:hypothetical protein